MDIMVNSEIVVNGHTLQADFFDADFIDRYEAALKNYSASTDAAKERMAAMATGDKYREGCRLIERFFDEVFGAGTGETVFSDCRGNLGKHLAGVGELVEWSKSQTKGLNDISNKYTQRQEAQLRRQSQQVEFGNFVAGQSKRRGGKRRH